jgi:hypothetical protein
MASFDNDPTDLDAAQQRDEDRRMRASVSLENENGDISWMLSGKRGRRIVRRQLREAGITAGAVSSSFHSNYGQMCFSEGLRVRGLQVLSKITQLLASGEIPFESFQLLMMEKDE